MNPGKSVRFEGSKLLPTTAKSFLSNSNSSSGNNRNRNKNELNESLLPNEYEMSQGIINSNSNGYNSGSNSSNSGNNGLQSSINRSNGINVDSNKIYLKNMKRAKRMIKEGYEWDVCLVLPNIEHEDYTDVPMREGYISMYSM